MKQKFTINNNHIELLGGFHDLMGMILRVEGEELTKAFYTSIFTFLTALLSGNEVADLAITVMKEGNKILEKQKSNMN